MDGTYAHFISAEEDQEDVILAVRDRAVEAGFLTSEPRLGSKGDCWLLTVYCSLADHFSQDEQGKQIKAICEALGARWDGSGTSVGPLDLLDPE